jgi:hypothetical protein
MKNIYTKSGASRKGQGTEVGIVELLQSLESQLARGIKLGWIIYKKLESIDDSVNLFAAQKKRELSSENSDGAKAP